MACFGESEEAVKDFQLWEDGTRPWNHLTQERRVLSSLSVEQEGVWGSSGVGGVVWDSAVVLAALIEHDALPGVGSVSGRHVLELGSGTGYAGLAAAARGAASVVLTDLPRTVALTRANVARNASRIGACAVSVAEADWCRAGDVAALAAGCDLVLAADCVYLGDGEGEGESTAGPFADALHEALNGAKVPAAVVVYKRLRTGQQALAQGFLSALSARFVVDEVPESALAEAHRTVGIHVLALRPMAY